MKSGTRIILTGASSGIGRSLAIACARRGARLVLVARRAEQLAGVEQEVRASGGEAVALAGDVVESATAARALQLAHETYGGVDMVIMNAGRGGPMFVDRFDAHEAERVMAVNYSGVLRMLEAVLPPMLEQRHGVIVGIGSLASYRGMPGSGAYNASKAAMRILLESIRIELRGTGIDVVTIAPGFVRTDMTATNEFAMPLLMEPAAAAERIIRAIDRRCSEYRFPLGTSLGVRFLQLLPNAIHDRVIRFARRFGARRAAR